MRKFKVFFIIGIILMAWLTGWSYRKEVPLPTPTSDLTNVPCRVSLVADADFHEARADGYDIRFTEDDGETLCKYEREHWSGGGGSAATAEFWVKAPSVLSAGGNILYIYYGKSDASDGEDAENVWDANFIAVWHLKEASSPYLDSTVNSHDSVDGTYPTQADGKIYKGQDFDRASSEYIGFGDHDDFSFQGGDFTIMALYKMENKPPSSGNAHGILSKDGVNKEEWQLRFRNDDGTNVHARAFIYNTGGNPYLNPVGTTSLSTGTWYTYHATFDLAPTPTLSVYINGVVEATDNSPAGTISANNTRDMVLGALSEGNVHHADGIFDEVRISNCLRSDAWIAFEHSNITTPPTLGSEEAAGGVTLVVADGIHSHSAESPDLTQVHNLTVDEALHGQSVDPIDLTQVHILTVAEALHSDLADNIDLIENITLAVNEALHGHSVDGIDLTQVHILSVLEALHSQLADNIDLTQAHILVVAETLHPHSVDPITLSQVHLLTVAECLNSHLADNIDLDVSVILVVNDGLHGQSVDPIVLQQVHNLVVSDGLHSHLADNIDLITAILLVVQDGLHGHSAENIDLSQIHNLIVADSLHGHLADNIVFEKKKIFILINRGKILAIDSDGKVMSLEE